LAFQESDDLIEDVVECHGFLTYQTCSTCVNCLHPHGCAPAAMLLSKCPMYPNRVWRIVIRAGIDTVTARWIGFKALQCFCPFVQRICDNDYLHAMELSSPCILVVPLSWYLLTALTQAGMHSDFN
jgi:hypothetical protein